MSSFKPYLSINKKLDELEEQIQANSRNVDVLFQETSNALVLAESARDATINATERPLKILNGFQNVQQGLVNDLNAMKIAEQEFVNTFEISTSEVLNAFTGLAYEIKNRSENIASASLEVAKQVSDAADEMQVPAEIVRNYVKMMRGPRHIFDWGFIPDSINGALGAASHFTWLGGNGQSSAMLEMIEAFWQISQAFFRLKANIEGFGTVINYKCKMFSSIVKFSSLKLGVGLFVFMNSVRNIFFNMMMNLTEIDGENLINEGGISFADWQKEVYEQVKNSEWDLVSEINGICNEYTTNLNSMKARVKEIIYILHEEPFRTALTYFYDWLVEKYGERIEGLYAKREYYEWLRQELRRATGPRVGRADWIAQIETWIDLYAMTDTLAGNKEAYAQKTREEMIDDCVEYNPLPLTLISPYIITSYIIDPDQISLAFCERKTTPQLIAEGHARLEQEYWDDLYKKGWVKEGSTVHAVDHMLKYREELEGVHINGIYAGWMSRTKTIEEISFQIEGLEAEQKKLEFNIEILTPETKQICELSNKLYNQFKEKYGIE